MSRPNELQRVAMRPSGWVRFWRTFFLFQLYRFVVLNLKMLAVIWKSHHTGHVARSRPVNEVPRLQAGEAGVRAR